MMFSLVTASVMTALNLYPQACLTRHMPYKAYTLNTNYVQNSTWHQLYENVFCLCFDSLVSNYLSAIRADTR